MRQGGVILPKIKVPAGLVPFESSLLGLQVAIRLLPLHVDFSLGTHFRPLCGSKFPLLERTPVRLD